MQTQTECKAYVAFGGHAYYCESLPCDGRHHEATHIGEYEDDAGELIETPVKISWELPL